MQRPGAFIDTFIEPGAGGLEGPVGFAFGPDDDSFYVVSLFDGGVPSGQVLQYDGNSGDFIQSSTPAVPPLIFPQDLAFGPGGSLFVANTGLDTVQQYDPLTGDFVGSLFAADTSLCDAPFGITADGGGFLYVSCTFTNNVLRYGIPTGQVDVFGSASSANAAPGGLSIGPDGALYVANFAANTIDRYDLKTGEAEVFVDEVDSPVQPAFGPNGDLYVSSNPTQKVGAPVPGKVLRYDGQTGSLIDDDFIPSLLGGLDGAGWLAFADADADADKVSTPEPGILAGFIFLVMAGAACRRCH